jgi:HSP20 family protein
MANFSIPRDFPFSVQDLRSEFDRLLDRAWHVGLNTAPLDGQDWAPCLDVVEEADAYRVRVEIPGVRGEDVEVAILGNTLTIKGTKPAPATVEGEDRRSLRAECRFGGFCRQYELPASVREDGVTASCKNGVLEVTIPKTPEVVGHKVKIQAED